MLNAWTLENSGIFSGMGIDKLVHAMKVLEKQQPGVTLEQLPPLVFLAKGSGVKPVSLKRVNAQGEHEVEFDRKGVARLEAGQVILADLQQARCTLVILPNGQAHVKPGLHPDALAQARAASAGDDMVARAHRWLQEGHVGVSSSKLCFVLAGVGEDERGDSHPRDPADLNRCIKFLDAVPQAREHLEKMRSVSGPWAALIDRWEALEAVLAKEQTQGDGAPETYALMREALDPFEARPTRPRP